MYCHENNEERHTGILAETASVALEIDPVEKMANKFMNYGALVRDKILTLNDMQRTGTGGSAGELAKDAHEINIIMIDMRHEMENIKDAYDESQKKHNQYKGKNEEKRARFGATCEKYKKYYEACNKLMNDMTRLKLERMSEETTTSVAGGGASSGAAVRSSVQSFIKRRRGNIIEKSGNLHDDPETSVQMKTIEMGKKKQNELLLQLDSVVREITESVKRIGVELDTQNEILCGQDKKVDIYKERLEKLNSGLTKYLGEQNTSNRWMYLIACMLILAIVGYFVSEFVKF